MKISGRFILSLRFSDVIYQDRNYGYEGDNSAMIVYNLLSGLHFVQDLTELRVTCFLPEKHKNHDLDIKIKPDLEINLIILAELSD